MALATALSMLSVEACIGQMAPSPFSPALSVPLYAQRFGRPPDPVTRSAAPTLPPLSGAGVTGFDSTGSVAREKKTAKRKAGDQHPPPPVPLAPPGPPQQSGGHTTAPQLAARASYAEAYRPSGLSLRRPLPEPVDAFVPTGLRIGTFVLRPSLDVMRGFDSNPARLPSGKGSGFTQVESELKLRSQWSRHEYGADLRGSFTNYDSLSSANSPVVDAKTFSRYDISRDTRVNLESRFYLSTDYPGSPNLPADVTKLPIFTSYGSSAGITQRFNRLEFLLKGSADRTAYEDSKLSDGTNSSNRDRDYNQYSGQVRASYDIMPGVRPFAEISVDKRDHDLAADRHGFQRNSRGMTPRIGTSFELGRKLTGEVSVGYLRRRYQDPALQDLRGLVANASLVWVATGLTTATLTANSRAEESVVAGVSGALRRDVALQIDHAFRRWLVGTVKIGYGLDQYVGNGREDVRTSLGAALTYKLTPEVWFKGEYRFDRRRSNAANADYDASIYLIGLKLQR